MASELTKLAPWQGVNIRRLRYFLAVAEELHFGRAAERLGIALPALTRRIVSLEGAISALPLDQSRSNIHLISAGDALLPRVRDIRARFADAARVAKRASEGSVGMLQIGFVKTAPFSILPGILSAYRTAHPGVELVLHAMNTSESRAAIIDRAIDVASASRDRRLLNLQLRCRSRTTDCRAAGE